MLARYAAQSIKCTMMALRFTRQISAIFAHSLKVSGIRCHKPILRFALPANVHAYCRGPANTLSTATRLARLHEPKKGSAAFVHMHALKSMRLCADTSWGGGTIARSLAPCVAVSIFDSESIIFNLSEGICVMKADANSNKREKNNTTAVKKPKQIPALMRLYTQPNQGWLE